MTFKRPDQIQKDAHVLDYRLAHRLREANRKREVARLAAHTAYDPTTASLDELLPSYRRNYNSQT